MHSPFEEGLVYWPEQGPNSIRGTSAVASKREGFPVRVEAYAGYRAGERPRRIHRDDEVIEVERILTQWRDPQADLWRFASPDGRTFLLARDRRSDSWVLTPEG